MPEIAYFKQLYFGFIAFRVAKNNRKFEKEKRSSQNTEPIHYIWATRSYK